MNDLFGQPVAPRSLPTATGSGWESWDKVSVADELRRRMRHFYLQVDGTMKFPNSAEGDLLKMMHHLLSPNPKASEGAHD